MAGPTLCAAEVMCAATELPDGETIDEPSPNSKKISREHSSDRSHVSVHGTSPEEYLRLECEAFTVNFHTVSRN